VEIKFGVAKATPFTALSGSQHKAPALPGDIYLSGLLDLNLEAMNLSYVLITPARNEEADIGRTIESVISQTVLPKKWVIVSDGSTDRTDEIVKRNLTGYPWIEFIRMPEHRDRQFAAKVQCFNAGYEKLKNIEFQIVANLDADISFDSDYFAFLLDKFAIEPALGVAGTPFVENGKHYDYKFTNIEHVSGACQMFRKECFEEIGGVRPDKRWGYRLGRSNDSPDEGMEDKNLY